MSNGKGVNVWCNDTPIGPDRPVRIFPGGRNRLALAFDGAGDGVVLRVETIAPDGRTHCETVTLTDGRAAVELGPFCVPAVYEYEAGVVYRRGYRLQVSVEDAGSGAILARYALAAVCSGDADAEWLLAGAPERGVYNDGYIPETPIPGVPSKLGSGWNPFSHSAAAMQPPLQVQLDPAVLVDRDQVTVWYRTRPDPAVEPLRARLVFRDAQGREMVPPVEQTVGHEWQSWAPDVTDWPVGVYTLELQPALAEGAWADGPRLRYRRDAADPLQVRVSPYTPFAMRRDPSRDVVEITDWPTDLPQGWETGTCGEDSALLCNGNPTSDAVRLEPHLTGTYAIFAWPVNTLFIRAGQDEVVRRIHEPERAAFGGMFVTVTDLTGQSIELHSNDLDRVRAALGDDEDLHATMLKLYASDGTRPTPFSEQANAGEIRSGVRRLHLVPVTPESARDFHEQTANPPYELRGVEDWWCYFQGADRVDPEQLDALLWGQRELGIKAMNWAVARSWVQYPSRLPDATMFPCAPISASTPIGKKHHHLAWEKILRSCDCLEYPLKRSRQYGLRLQGWLAMNRHYGANSLGGVFTSPWAAQHPEYYQHRKDVRSVDYTRLEYFFPEVRKERLDIFEEVADYGPDGVVLGCCRQPPMTAYNPTMVAAYKEKTGIDPTTIDIDDGQPFLDWIQWRADFFTELLRELAARLDAVRKKLGRRIPVTARIPGVGLQWNLAQGMDVRTWIAEGLIDELQLDPLESAAGQASHDVRPYLALGRAHGVPVFGGVNATTGVNLGFGGSGGGRENFTPVVGLRRAIGLLRSGLDGIEIYEAEIMSRGCERRWLIPLLGDPQRAERWLEDSNLDAVFPVTARNAALGHDNHWFVDHETLHGARGFPRGTKRAL